MQVAYREGQSLLCHEMATRKCQQMSEASEAAAAEEARLQGVREQLAQEQKELLSQRDIDITMMDRSGMVRPKTSDLRMKIM